MLKGHGLEPKVQALREEFEMAATKSPLVPDDIFVLQTAEAEGKSPVPATTASQSSTPPRHTHSRPQGGGGPRARASEGSETSSPYRSPRSSFGSPRRERPQHSTCARLCTFSYWCDLIPADAWGLGNPYHVISLCIHAALISCPIALWDARTHIQQCLPLRPKPSACQRHTPHP